MSQNNLTETSRVSHLWLQQVRRTVKLHAMGETLIGACALHIRVCFSRSVTAWKLKTIPSASDTARKQIQNTATAVHEQVSVSFWWCWITFLPDQKGWFHGYVSAPHLSGKIFKNVPLKGNREESWVDEDSERQHRLSTLRKLGEFWEVGCGIKSGMQRTMPREETTVRGPLIHHPWPCASHFSNCHMSKSFHPGTSGWKWRSCEGRTLIRQNVPFNHSKVGLRQFQT